MTTIDPRTIAADIMCGNARSITPAEVWAHIGQAYDVTEIDPSIADEVAELIAKTGIDLIWPDGTKDTGLDAARVEIERLTAELAKARQERDEYADDNTRVAVALVDVQRQLTAANHRADGLAADVTSLTKAQTAYANENARLRSKLADILAMAEQFDTPRDSGRVRVFLGDLKHLADRTITGQQDDLSAVAR